MLPNERLRVFEDYMAQTSLGVIVQADILFGDDVYYRKGKGIEKGLWDRIVSDSVYRGDIMFGSNAWKAGEEYWGEDMDKFVYVTVRNLEPRLENAFSYLMNKGFYPSQITIVNLEDELIVYINQIFEGALEPVDISNDNPPHY